MSEKFHFGDSSNLMQDDTESTLDQIEVNTGKLNKYGKTWNSSLGDWTLLWTSLINYHVVSHLGCQPK